MTQIKPSELESKKEEVLAELTDMFQITKPDSSYLADDEDTAEDVKNIEVLLSNSETPINEKISALHNFNSEWFPDEEDEDEQEQYRALLQRSSDVLNA